MADSLQYTEWRIKEQIKEFEKFLTELDNKYKNKKK